MHLIGHIAKGMELGGPARAYWLFFERLNRYCRDNIKTHKYPESSCYTNICLEMHGQTITVGKERMRHIQRFANSSKDKQVIQQMKNWYSYKEAKDSTIIKGKTFSRILESEEYEEGWQMFTLVT